MPDVLTWILGVAGKEAISRISKSFAPDPLIGALNRELDQWAEQNAAVAAGERHTGALLTQMFSPSTYESLQRERLREAIERRQVPEVDVWFAALYERWEQIRYDAGEEARPFFKLTPEAAESRLRDLAKRFERVCIQTDGPMAVGLIVDRLNELRPLVTSDWSDHFLLDDARSAFLDYSQPLLKWPTSLSKTGDHIERAESETILRRLRDELFSTTILIGERGVGKSSLLATTALQVIENGWTLFAIKADFLNETTMEEITDILNLKVPLPQLLTESAKQGKTVLIVDQLDAVAEIADRSARRLNFLLNLIHRVAGRENLHIILSSRPFELRTDARLRTIRDATEIELQMPKWESIAEILVGDGHRPETFGEPLREILRNPWWLNIYLDVASADQQFASMSELLEAVWMADVTSASDGVERASLLDEIAADMTANEQLFVPSSIGDRRVQALNGLVANNFLVREGHRLSFRHQTFYEFIVARQFARDDSAFLAHVRARQDGLFVRPTVLASLVYMRDAARPRYIRVVETLLTDESVRLHIRSLVLDFVASQRQPDGFEVAHVIARLEDRIFCVRVLYAARGSPHWFRHLRDEEAFRKILRDPTRATYAVGVLAGAMDGDRENVLQLVSEEWIRDAQFDGLAAQVISAGNWFEGAAMTYAKTILARSDHEWLVDQAATSSPAAAIQMLAADLNRRVPDELVRRAVAEDSNAKHQVEQALKSDMRYELLEELATKSPAQFLKYIWPWFARVCEGLANELVSGYRRIWYLDLDFDDIPDPTIVDAMLTVARTLARSEPSVFRDFVQMHSDTDVLVLQMILAAGVEVSAETDPASAIDYILGDSRRLALGSEGDRTSQTARIIESAYARVDSGRRERVQAAILQFDRYPARDEDDAILVERRSSWNRLHRLQLLEAIPETFLHGDALQTRDELRIEFPDGETRRPGITGGVVGPRVTAEELPDKSDDEWLSLFNEITDSDEERFRHLDVDITRSGGVNVQANALAEVAKVQPDRCEAFLSRFRPDAHQKYAAAVIQGIGPTRSVSALTRLVLDLEAKGFNSDEFRALVAAVLGDAARRDGGLDDEMVALLEKWLATYPPSPEFSDNNRGKRENPEPIIVSRFGGNGIMFGIPHRSQIGSAIAKGLLSRTRPNISKWLEVFRNEIPRDSTDAFWWQMLAHMAPALNDRVDEANEVISLLFSAHPHLAHDTRILLFLGNFMPRLEPQLVRMWIEPLRDSDDEAQRQAFGELAMLCNAWHNDEWTQIQIDRAIECGDAVVLTGIGFVASLSWTVKRLRATASRVLTTIASLAPTGSTAAVEDFLVDSLDDPIDSEATEILNAVLANESAISDLIEPMTNIAERNVALTPEISAQIATRVLDIVGEQLKSDLRKMDISAGLTTIAITLHRQRSFRGVGLSLFERLIELGVREADAALEILDRRATTGLAVYQRRRHYRRGRRSRRRR